MAAAASLAMSCGYHPSLPCYLHQDGRKNLRFFSFPLAWKPSWSHFSRLEPPKAVAGAPSLPLDERRIDPGADIRRFCQMGSLEEAIRLLSDANLQHCKLHSEDFCSVLQLCAEFRSLADGRKVHSIMSSNGIEIDAALGSKLVFMYAKCGDLREGRRVFDRMDTKAHPFLWNLLMFEHAKAGNFEESIALFKWMWISGIRPDSRTFSCILKCIANLGSVREGEWVHGYLLKLGFEDYNAVANALIALYSKCKRIESAIDMFDQMTDRDIISWNSIISGCVSNGLSRKGVELVAEMWFSRMDMDLATEVSVLPACAELGLLQQGKVLHGYSVKAGFVEEVTLSNSLLDMYAKCGNLDNALQVFEKMGRRTVVSWTSMISGYTRDGRFEEAIRLFGQMELKGVQPDLYTITSVLHACACNGAINHGRHLHDYIERNGLELNLFVANALMDMYAKCGSMEDARSIFDSTACKDIISWNTMIGGYSKNSSPNEALALFRDMLLQLRPNCVTIACILPAIASLSCLERGREIHGHLLRAGNLEDRHVVNALVDMYAKCGALILARLLFNCMVEKDLISWTAMIAGYGMHGYGKEAIAVFKEMRKKGIQPDEVSFIAILYACSHSGLIDEGWRFFNIMRNDYKIEPALEHYACMVDLLSRAGNLKKAYKFIESMPIKPDSTVWGALLCGCRTHRNVELAEKVAEHVFNLEPGNTGYYVLLANIYAEAEKWESVKKLRERMGSRRLRKNPGCSWIEIKTQVHIFVSGDKYNPKWKKCASFFDEVRRRMKDEGYIPNMRYALMNVEDNVKEEALCGHSEKLAIAFGVLNSSGGKPIRVSKNLRVCGDCHEVAKFISKITGRVIILRDSNRFHHFQEGRCSCRGYW